MVNYVMAENSETRAHDAHREAVDGFGDWSEDDAFDEGDEGDPGSATRGGPQGTFLTDLGETLRGAGLSVTEFDGWQQRSRRSGGYDGGPIAIVLHHTASQSSSDGQNDARFIVTKDGGAPVANLYLDRTGNWWVLAAGATNTNGRGGPWGPIPENGANARVIGIEAANNGLGEPWPAVMQDKYVTGVAALADRYGIDSNNVLSHHEWAPTRKIDPAGPSRFGSINRANTWDMNMFRSAVNAARSEPGTVHVTDSKAVTSGVNTYVVRPGEAWWSIAEKTLGDPSKTWQTLADANGGVDRVLLAGAVLTIPGTPGASGGTVALAFATASAQFPGEAKRGMQGPIVVAWQEGLIAHGIIADTKDNHDGDYGEGMERKVLELQQSWGWSDADGIAGSGTWKRLHSQT